MAYQPNDVHLPEGWLQRDMERAAARLREWSNPVLAVTTPPLDTGSYGARPGMSPQEVREQKVRAVAELLTGTGRFLGITAQAEAIVDRIDTINEGKT